MGMSIGSAGSKRGRATPEMNVTPLVDVVLVLLIIFMVITPLLAKQFWLALPDKKEESAPASPSDKAPIVVTVTRSGALRINREVVSDAEFPLRLRRALAASGERTAFFDAHDDTPLRARARRSTSHAAAAPPTSRSRSTR